MIFHYFKVDRTKNGEGTTPPTLFQRELTHDDLVKWISNPVETTSKQGQSLICFTELRDLGGGKYSNGKLKRNTDNSYRSFGFLVDYDSGASFNTVTQQLTLKDITFYAYTSYSHGDIEKGTSDRFRVFVPFNSPIDGRLWKHPSIPHTKNILEEKFSFGVEGGNPDPVSFRIAHAQAPPVKHPNRAYRFHFHNGKLLNPMPIFKQGYEQWFQMKNSQPVVVSKSLWLGNTEYAPKDSIEAFKKAVSNSTINKLDALPWNNRGIGVIHYSLLTIIANLKHCEFTEYEAYDLLRPYTYKAYKGEIEHIIKDFFK